MLLTPPCPSRPAVESVECDSNEPSQQEAQCCLFGLSLVCRSLNMPQPDGLHLLELSSTKTILAHQPVECRE